MTSHLLALNAGSSSLKFALYDATSLECLCRGGADAGEGVFEATGFAAHPAHRCVVTGGFQAGALDRLVEWLDVSGVASSLRAGGHRVVHGGTRFLEPVMVDAGTLAEMDRLRHLAPLHLPANLDAIHLLAARLPALPQVACFDTMFHAGQSRLVRSYGLPREVSARGYIRYGFHGLSYEFVASRLVDVFGADTGAGRVIVAHLGNGASLCAIRHGRSVATTLGYSTLDGLVMGTRCGPLDPGLVLQLVRDAGGDVDQVETMLYKESGLAGVSGIGNDMRRLLAATEEDARFAIDLFVHRIVRQCGSLAAALGGLDALVFTGGIGYRSAEIRQRVCGELEWLGVEPDQAANEASATRFESPSSRVALACLETDEEMVIAAHTRRLTER